MDTPASLLERLRQPEETAAWERFVDLYTPLLFSWARRLGLQAPDAADLVQDVFAVLVEKLPDFRYDRQKSFQAWLRTVLLNKWRNRHRRQVEASLEAVAPGLSDLVVPPEQDAFTEAEYRRHLVHRALEVMRAEFQPCTWRACWEFVVQERPAAEVAAELGITVNAVYLAKSRVLRRLREELDGLLD
jgi:RNA polymerase sigma-70 factor (ECF subfamily)